MFSVATHMNAYNIIHAHTQTHNVMHNVHIIVSQLSREFILVAIIILCDVPRDNIMFK